MGTTIFQTEKPAGRVLVDEFHPYRVRMWTDGGMCAAVALVVPVTDDNRADLARVYNLDGVDKVTMALVVRHDGTLRGSGPRSVSIKVMDEGTNPNATGGANAQFLSILTPLISLDPEKDRDRLLAHWAHDWRAKVAASVAA